MAKKFFKVDGNYKPKDPRSSVNSQVQTPKEHDSKKHKLHISLEKKKKAGQGDLIKQPELSKARGERLQTSH